MQSNNPVTPEQKQRLAEMKRKQVHSSTCPCSICFLLTLLDQAQRDTERVPLYREIEAEQRHGREKYGRGPEDFAHDNNNADDLWYSCIKDHNARAMSATPMERRQHLVKVAGLAISAIQSYDRKAKKALDQAALTRGEGEK